MKRAICLVLLLLVIFSVAVFTVSCGDPEEPINVEKNPTSEEGKDPSGITTNPSIGNDENNTWNEDGTAIGRPVGIPSN